MRLLILLHAVFTFFPAIGQVALVNAGFSTYGENIGGKEEFKHLFDHEVWLPEEYTDRKFDTTIVLSYSITPEGKLGNVRVVRSGSGVVDQEAIRILKLLEWNPAIYLNEPAETHHSMELNFNSKRIKKSYKKRGYEQVLVEQTDQRIFEKPSVKPQFNSSSGNLALFLAENLQYPGEARAMNVSGDVVLSFIVEKKGYTSNINVVKPLGAGCDQEAIRVIRKMRWTPAQEDGKPVRSRVILPVTFQLMNNVNNNVNTEQRSY